MERYINPKSQKWDGPDADFTPYSDDLPWCMIPEKKITVEDVKYVLSSHYQGTHYDPYAAYGEKSQRGAFRSIGVNRTDFLAHDPDAAREWKKTAIFCSGLHLLQRL